MELALLLILQVEVRHEPAAPKPGAPVLVTARLPAGVKEPILETQAVAPGNYTLYEDGSPAAGFSLNVRPEECQLTSVPVKKIEAALGPGALWKATPGADPGTVWAAVRSRLAHYLADQGVAHVDLVRAEEPPEQSPASGKFRQVIAASQRFD